MKIYIAGKMTGLPDYNRTEFNLKEKYLEWKGHIVLNPARHPLGLDREYYMSHAYIDIDHCDAVYFLDGWERSEGARMEKEYAQNHDKICLFRGMEIEA